MKSTIKYILALGLTLALGLPAGAQHAATSPARVTDVNAERTDDSFYLRFNLDLSAVRLKSEEQAAFTPVLLDSTHRATLPGAIVSGRNRYLRDLRAGYSPDGYTIFRSGRAGAAMPVEARLPFEDWMLDASLVLTDTISGCSCRPFESGDMLVTTFDMRQRVFEPVFVYITPAAEVEKTRSADGHAYIDFPVNKTEIYPDYRRNPVELANIRDTISIIKNDPDYTITSLSLRGYASPEGSYANNERLARGRTEALRTYIRGLYDFPLAILHTSWQAEDWEGLIAWLRASDMPDRDAIIEIATTPVFDGNPDGREWKIKSTYPEQYRILLADVYPGLRHTDYTVSYTVRTFTTVDEIRAVFAVDPRKLSLNELYKLALSYPAGSAEFIDVFETAARLYPESPEASLNAAIPALQAGDLARAERYLARAGESPEATYARAILTARRGDLSAALDQLKTAAAAGIEPANDAAAQLEEIIRHTPKTNK
ncbi:MAG: DUF3868 domain-containing protein [Muribaculaceae bacterium]|nr:DUF3868 domain-containing protein [Muribaculaceae bacterium]